MDILRDGTVIYTVDIDEKTILTHQLMNDHQVDAVWKSTAPLDLTLGDYIEVGVEKFYLNRKPDVEKKNNFTYVYNAVFESEQYRLFNKIFMHQQEADFTYFGDAQDYMLLLLENINSIDTGWTLDYDIPFNVIPKYISFNGESCRQALMKITEEFEIEFRLVQRTIIIRQDVGFNTNYRFEYGREKGLYKLIRSSDPQQGGVITRLYVFGGNRNLAFDYRGGARRLVFEEDGKRYIEANTELYGIKEGTVTFDEIFPQRTGSVVSSSAPNRFIDTAIDFDLNDFLLEGNTAKVVFKSGALSGYEFEIRSFNNSTKEVIFNDFIEANDYVLPNELNHPEEGDLYTFVDIKMPQSYIDQAEADLLEAGEEYLEKKKSPTATYTLEVDEKFVRVNGVELASGQRVRVVDTGLGLDEMIRIFSVSYPLVNPSKVTAEITDKIPYTVAERLIKDNKTVKGEVITIDRSREENYREAVRRIRKMQSDIFDPDGYFDQEKIRPISIETMSLLVGTVSQNFLLENIFIDTNYQGDANRINFTAGNLIHIEIEIEGVGYVWAMDPYQKNDLETEKKYWVYARCNRNALQGAWKITEDEIRYDDEAGWYHFLLGRLWEVQNGSRYLDTTKGITSIVGGTIKTGLIQSLDGLTKVDLDGSKFTFGLPEDGIDFGYTKEGQLTIRGSAVIRNLMADEAFIGNLRVNSLKTGLTGKRMEILAYTEPDEGQEPQPLHNQKFYDDDGNLAITIDTEVDTGAAPTPKAGIKIQQHGSTRTQYVTQNGISSEGSFLGSPSLPTNQHLGSMIGVLKEKFSTGFGIRAGVIGHDATPYPGAHESYGGWFNSLKSNAINIGVRQTTGSTVCTPNDTLISCYNSSAINVDLPANPRPGRVIFVRRNNTGAVNIRGNGHQILVSGLVNEIASVASSGRGRLVTLFYDGSYWTFNYQIV
jgi:hypothetical protein